MHRVAFLLALLLLSSCTAPHVRQAPLIVGGSKADGVVEFSYQIYGGMEARELVDWEAVEGQAKAFCQNWGYASAVSFPSEDFTCQMSGAVNCGFVNAMCCVWDFKRKYQCLETDSPADEGG